MSTATPSRPSPVRTTPAYARPSVPTPRTVRAIQRKRMATGTTLFVIVAGALIAWLQLAYGVEAPPASHLPVVVFASPVLDPVLVRAGAAADPVRIAALEKARAAARAEKAAKAKAERGRKLFARLSEKVPVSFTQYCLQGRTRRDNWVREGIVAADPRVFPLGHYVEIFVAGKYMGRYLVDDTGGVIKGHIIDIWTPSCKEARRFGRKHGYAVLVPKE